jgi:hypothetical protein
MAWGDLGSREAPKPTLVLHKQNHTESIIGQTDQGISLHWTVYSETVEMGWMFTSSDLEYILTVLPVMTEGLVRISSILSDGFANYRGVDFSSPYEYCLLSLGELTQPSSFNQDRSSRDGLPTWIPADYAGLWAEQTSKDLVQIQSHSPFYSDDDKSLLATLSYDGVGRSWASAANTYIFSVLIPDKKWQEAERLAMLVYKEDIPNESTNALSNSGISNFLAGDRELAILRFMQALNRPDQFAEAEASWWLAEIYKEIGDVELADSFSKRCEVAGGYTPF